MKLVKNDESKKKFTPPYVHSNFFCLVLRVGFRQIKDLVSDLKVGSFPVRCT